MDRRLLAGMSLGLHREVAISQFVAQATGGEPDVILNGVRVSDAEPDWEARRVLVMQRLEAEKGTATALRAWAISGLADRGWSMTIAGRGSQRAELERLAAQLGIVDSVVFTGFSAAPEELRKSASVFLATAPAEPFGLSLVEAMACGLPVVAADGGAHRETLGEFGSYFPPGDAGGCAAILVAMAQSAALRKAKGDGSRIRQRSVLTLERHVEQLETLYRASLA
jgi:glycosyltransferase involved in cell wall biosynthesis